MEFDLFVKVADRFICHTLHHDPLDMNRLESLKRRGVDRVFIRVGDEGSYQTYLDSGIDALGSEGTSTEAHVATAQAILSGLADGDATIESEPMYKLTERRVSKISEFLLSDKNLVKVFLKNSGVSKDVSQHSSTVATLSLALAARIGITERKDLLELGLAALVHDIAKEPRFDWLKPSKQFVDEQSFVYIAHPAGAEELLGKKAFVSKGIKDLVRDHEEIGDGQGYPGKKKLELLSPVQQVFNVCNHFDRSSAESGIPPLEAAKQFFIDKIGLFKLDLMTALSEVLTKK